jgi:hypothetical protein
LQTGAGLSPVLPGIEEKAAFYKSRAETNKRVFFPDTQVAFFFLFFWFSFLLLRLLHLSNFIRSAVANLYRLALCLYSCYFCVSLPFSVFVSGFLVVYRWCCEREGVLCVVSCGVERKPKEEEEEEPWRRLIQS